MRSFCLLLCLLSLAAAAQNLPTRIDSLFSVQNDPIAIGFSGVVLVADNGKPVYHKAFGFREFEKSIPLKTDDIFELASVSKQFTAMIIMMLKERKKLHYDDPVEKYLSIPYKGITIRHLLTHTSGLPDYQDIMDKYWDKTRVAGNADCIEYLNKYAPPRLFEPGEKYEYSNTGYLLLASIAEKTSGKDFIELSRKWIFRPLKMKSTDIRTLEQKKNTGNFVIGHIYVKDRDKFVRADSFPSSDYTIWLGNRKGPGRISSTAADLLKWDQALYTERLVSKATLEEAFSPMKLNGGLYSRYGFGWSLRIGSSSGKVVQHTGSNPGYSTMIIRFIDQKKTIIMLNNNEHPRFSDIIQKIEEMIR